MAQVRNELELALLSAVEANDLPQATELLKRGAQVNARGPLPYTVLMLAAGRGSVQMTEKLLHAGADVHALDSSLGASALHFAAQGGVVDVARLLLDAGAFINLQTATVGLTPLINAVWAKQVPMVRFLLERGASLDIKTHLSDRSRMNNKRQPASVTVWDFILGDDPIWTAGFTVPEKEAWGRQLRALLEEHRRRDEAAAVQPLMKAVQQNNLAEVQRLLAAGTDVNAASPVLGSGDDGQTPLLVACFLGHTEVVRALLAAGANPRITDYLLKATPAHKAAYAGQAGALLALREHGGVEINAQGPYNGYTALHDSIWHGHREALEVILDWPGVRLDLRGLDGRTPYDLARALGYDALAGLLRERL